MILVSMFGSSVYSQKNFVEVKVSLKSGAELEGFIDYFDWKNNPKELIFKEKITSEEVILLTQQ
ncbi:MAG: hypothetical protein ACK40K_05975, partial [Raineya sp.]